MIELNSYGSLYFLLPIKKTPFAMSNLALNKDAFFGNSINSVNMPPKHEVKDCGRLS